MSNKRNRSLFKKLLKKGLLSQNESLLKEKAAKNELVINCDENGNIVSIPAKDIIARHRQYQ